MKRLPYRRLVLLIFTVLGLSACQAGEGGSTYTTAPNFITHNNSRFNFSVDIPDNWDYTVNGTEDYEATAAREADPTAGIVVNVGNDPEQLISVYGQVGTLVADTAGNPVVEDIVTQTGLTGKKYIREDQNNISIHLVFNHNQLSDQGYNTRALGCSIQMSKDVYEQNKDTLELILQSIRIT